MFFSKWIEKPAKGNTDISFWEHPRIISWISPKSPPLLIVFTQNHFSMLIARLKWHVAFALFSHKPFIISFPIIPRSINPACQHPIPLILTVGELKCCYDHLIERLVDSWKHRPRLLLHQLQRCLNVDHMHPKTHHQSESKINSGRVSQSSL